MKTYIIYCDESIQKGPYFSHFYGGAFVDEQNFHSIVQTLNCKKHELNFFGEVKWTKITQQYEQKYIDFINLYFDLIKHGMIKVRIQFCKNDNIPNKYDNSSTLDGFYRMYYQFFKWGFGLQYCNPTNEPVWIKTYFDKLPNTRQQNAAFKNYIFNVQNTDTLFNANVKIRREDITDVDSKKHVILQGMDIILGAMQFKLNRENKAVNPVTGKRGKKTRAKENVYRAIQKNITEIYPNFNVGITTGIRGDITNRWNDPYRHWSFQAYEK